MPYVGIFTFTRCISKNLSLQKHPEDSTKIVSFLRVPLSILGGQHFMEEAPKLPMTFISISTEVGGFISLIFL